MDVFNYLTWNSQRKDGDNKGQGHVMKVHDQPERSKREDLIDSLINSQKPMWDSVEIDIKFAENDLGTAKMRCSEHGGNVVRDK